MKRKIFSVLIILCFVLSSFAGFAQTDTDSIIILFENDAHCSVEGYAKLAAMKNELKQNSNYVGVVSSGDFVQGGSLGVVSKGEYIINLMNMVGYDAAALGNHEFDYKLERLLYLTGLLKAKTVCCNLISNESNKTVFDPYTIVSYGNTDVAYIGVTTPDTITSSSPAQFKNDAGEYSYSFEGNNLCETVQKNIDAAKKDGADYIIALTHLGTENVYEQWSAQTLIKNTSGLDAVLDGHSHSVVEQMTVCDKSGNDVVVSSAGTKFANIGKLTISDGKIKTELISTESYEKKDETVTKYIEEINDEYKKLGERKIGESKVALTTVDNNGKRIIRTDETNLGDLCADAYREMTGADIGFINGGGIRDSIDIGDITFNEILSVFPFNNDTCVAEVTGQQILDALEFSVMDYPNERGGFQQVSGIAFEFDPMVESGIVLDENTAFAGVEGERRVKNVRVLNSETNEYEPINAEKTYKLASHSYLIDEHGDGYSMLKDAKNIIKTGVLDVELLENYITEKLGGEVGENYAQSKNRINVLDNYIPLRKTFEEKGCEVIWTMLEPYKIVVNANGRTLIFTANTNTVDIGGQSYISDRMCYIEDGVTYISADCVEACIK